MKMRSVISSFSAVKRPITCLAFLVLGLGSIPMIEARSVGHAPTADPQRLKADVEMLTEIRPSRSAANWQAMQIAASRITTEFLETGCRFRTQGFRVVVCEPDNSQLLGSGLPQERDADGAPSVSHPNFRPHLMQGWSPDFIPKLAEDVVVAELIDEIIPINGLDSLRLAKDLARQEGIFTGITGGATLAGALEVAQRAPEGANIVCMLPDTGERYLSTTLFEDVPADMTAEEIEISQSTPRYRFDPTPPVDDDDAPPPVEEEIVVTPEAVAFVDDVVGDNERPLVMFALEWCEFCWSVRKLFAEYDIPFRSVDLDSVEYQKDNWGGDIRAVLKKKLGSPTIPQIFLGGEYMGGATETFDAFNDGHLRDLLEKNGIAHKDTSGVDAYSFLPTWLHPR